MRGRSGCSRSRGGRPVLGLCDAGERFAGTRSGRKAVLAERMARELATGELPRPLAGLLDRLGRE